MLDKKSSQLYVPVWKNPLEYDKSFLFKRLCCFSLLILELAHRFIVSPVVENQAHIVPGGMTKMMMIYTGDFQTKTNEAFSWTSRNREEYENAEIQARIEIEKKAAGENKVKLGNRSPRGRGSEIPVRIYCNTTLGGSLHEKQGSNVQFFKTRVVPRSVSPPFCNSLSHGDVVNDADAPPNHNTRITGVHFLRCLFSHGAIRETTDPLVPPQYHITRRMYFHRHLRLLKHGATCNDDAPHCPQYHHVPIP